MNSMLKALSDICRRYPLEEKILLTSSYTDGNELCQALAREAGGYLNLRPDTLTGLARAYLEDQLYEKGLTFISGYQELLLVEEIISRLENEDRLKYFARSGEAPGLISAISRSIKELRQCGINKCNLDTAAFVKAEKGQDLQLILEQHADLLEARNYIDGVTLLEFFIDFIVDNPTFLNNKIFIVPGFQELSPLEERLAEVLAAVILPVELISGLALSRLQLCRENEQESPKVTLPPEDDLWYMFSTEQQSSHESDGSPELFHAYGMYNEAREVIRRLYSANIPFDQVAVAYLNSGYVNVFEHLAQISGFNLTCAEGFPLAATNPGQAAAMLLDWFAGEYSLQTLKPLLLEGCIRTASDDMDIKLYPQQLLNLLRRASVGKGAAEYARLEQQASRYRDQAQNLSPEDPRYEYALRNETIYRQAFALFNSLIQNFPPIDHNGEIAFPQLVNALLEAVKKLAVIRNEKDAEALQTIENVFNDLELLSNRNYTPEKAREKLIELLNALRVGASVSRAGALHLVRYQRLMYLARPYTCIVGLDGHSFPGRTGQDPILLDKERVLVSALLKKQEDEPRRRELLMGAALASRRGKVCLSYFSYDTAQGRKNYPSSLLLQVLRLKKGDPGLDYSDLSRELGPVIGYCPSGSSLCLDEMEWWLTQILARRINNLDEILPAYFPGIQQGMEADRARCLAAITEYDGQLRVQPEELDPRVNQKIAVSCSRLEMMAKCPFKYYIAHVLGAFPPEENIPDRHQWLDPMQRGSLLHRVYQEFMTQIITSQEQVTFAHHRTLIEEIALSIIKEYREVLTPPSEAVYRYEVGQILLCCEIFLKCEEESEYRAVCLEAPFGLGEEAVHKAVGGSPQPLKIALSATRELNVRGIIDRIDHIEKNCYAVWDYKTGGTYGYSESGYLMQGRQIQHAVYSLAAEQILKRQGIKNPVVDISGYYFPSDKGEGQRFYRQCREPGQLIRVLNLLCDLMAEGQFLSTASKENCTYCEYQEVCDYEDATAKMAFLLMDDDLTGLERRKELNSFE